jgi:hypothetical protein
MAGNIIDEEGAGVTDCYIQVKAAKSNAIYNYFNTGSKNTFKFTTELPVNDSVLLSISHIGYKDTIVKKWVTNETGKLNFNVILYFKPNILTGVTVKSSPVWKHGDSTFYRVDYFKEGEEKKLKDLIVKMPGFEIDANGNLLYHKKRVDKIRIDGEEIFSDKIKMMLNSFPVHVLSTIQAIEHESSSKLLNGFSGEDLLVVNLGLNKEKLKAAFGDGEAGAGTNGRYLLNPVVFSVLSKIKAGFVGNYNNTANGIGYAEEYEFKRSQENTAENWLMNNHPIQIIPDFESRWYIKNNMWDSRLQINIPVSKKIKSQTQINFLKDNQKQDTYNASALFSDTAYIQQNDTSNIIYKPVLVNVQQTLLWSINDNKELKIAGNFYGNFSMGSQNSIYRQNNTISFLNNNIANHWQSISLNTNYIHRLSAQKVDELFIEINSQQQHQNGNGISGQWSNIFNIPNSAYNNLFQQIENPIHEITAGWKRLINKKNSFNKEITFRQTTANLNNNTYLRDKAGLLPVIYPTGFSNSGKYKVNVLKSGISKGFKNVLNGSFTLTADGGFATGSAREGVNKNFMLPVFSISARYYSARGKRFGSGANLSFTQEQPNIYQLQQNLYPSGIGNFKTTFDATKPVRDLFINYGANWSWSKNSLSRSMLSFFYNHNFSQFASGSRYFNFASIQTDSLVNFGTDAFGIQTTQTIPSVLLNALVTIKAGVNISPTVVIGNRSLYQLKSSNSLLSLSVKRNWNKKYFINLATSYTLQNLSVPAQITGQFSSKVSNLTTSFTQRAVVGKQLNIIGTASLFNNNLFTKNNASFVFADAEVNLKAKKLPLFFILRAENLANTRRYYNYENSVLTPSFYSVPLMPRSLLLTVRYEL